MKRIRFFSECAFFCYVFISIKHFCFLCKAVLFWLNYKAAYDNWNEQRMALHKDIHMATKEVVDMLPGIQQTSAQAFGTLFLQLTVNDLGICLPITNTPQVIVFTRKQQVKILFG